MTERHAAGNGEPHRARRWRQVRALLAGGLVLGLGASATIAAWTDSENASGDFRAGAFMIEANADGTWNNTRQMTFTTGTMFPGSVTYAPVLLRTTPDTTVAGELKLSGAPASSSGAIIGSLEYRTVLQPVPAGSPRPACGAAAFTGGAQYVVGGSSSWQPLATALTAGSSQRLEAAQRSTLQYCFEVRLRTTAPNAAQGTSASSTWTWDATSVPTG